MKLRITNNSVRLRLGRQEVARLSEGTAIEEHADLAPLPLVYSLSTSADAAAPSASFSGGRLAIVLPLPMARQWAGSDQVGIEAHVPGGRGESVQLLVEKDFKCLHGDSMDQSDAYPHPMDKG